MPRRAAYNLGKSLVVNGLRTEAIALLRDQLPHARRLGPDHEVSLLLRTDLAKTLYHVDAPRDDVREAVAILTDVRARARRVMGATHPVTIRADAEFPHAQLCLELAEARETRDLDALRRLQRKLGL